MDSSKLEITKLIVSLVTPIAVVIVGYTLNRRLKSIDNAQWQSRKIIEKRLEIYDKIAPDLNLVFCFCRFLGYWKEISPKQMIETKRALDKNVNIYRHLLSEKFFSAYEEYIHHAFRTFTGHGKDALIRSAISNRWGDRTKHANYEWDVSYSDMFDASNIPSDEDLQCSYLQAMQELRKCMGLDGENL